MNYGLKNTLNFKETEIRDEEKNSSLTQAGGEKRERDLDNSIELFGV